MSIQINKLNMWYGPQQALYDITLSITPLSVTALIGPSGCGKSTLLRCLNRMHEETPGTRVTGSVIVEGFDIYGRAIRAMHVRRRIGMVFQQPNPVPHYSIWDNVAIGPRLNGGARGQALHDVVERSLKQAALWEEVKERLGQSAGLLSGGQQQRLCIARALALNPHFILMDEPCSALDPIATLQIEELILELKQTYTVVIVTHNMQQAGRVADTTAFLLQGRLIEVGETGRFFTHPQQKETEDYITGRFS
jgi:phosphate transport system ATP-binding protein